MIYGGQALHGCITLPSDAITEGAWPISCPSVSSDIPLELRPEPRYALHATLHWDFASRYSAWQTKIATNRYRFLNQLRRSKNPQANTATLLSEEIQNAKYY